ncbi:hypothetical protein PVK06_017376 [Gossypium arboreum]|uniref:Uncharacterized protein n=1 Tax=Gossypium arboreum TaxID=29729 RepID=A0ABR0Q2H2_GOSAR|nr:hypothetical protein PVK06_017376 [Gossypium arboreum]
MQVEETSSLMEVFGSNHYLFSPKAPRCSSRSKELPDSSLNLPLLKSLDFKSVSISSLRLSLSSSSSGHEHDDLLWLSLDSNKPSTNPFAPCRNINPNPNSNPPRMRMVKPRPGSWSDQTSTNGARIGRSSIQREPTTSWSKNELYRELERSSSSSSNFNGSPRFKQRGMERSYSTSV